LGQRGNKRGSISADAILLRRIISIALTALLYCHPAAADIIHFKDGMRTLCQGRAWEEKDEVRCEHQGGVLVYLKADVQFIEKTLPSDPLPENPPDAPPDPAAARRPAPPAPPAAAAPAAPAPPPPAEAVQPASPPPAAPAPSAASPSVTPPPRVAPKFPSGPPKPESGLMFYDPRRPKRYWSSETRHHDSFPEAVAALAAEYDRPPEWVERHLGDTNDLVEIRHILEAQLSAPAEAEAPPETAAEAPVDFYNPRRPQPYWSSESGRHATYAEAVHALAKEFSETPEWVESHMGESNDLNEIRRNLSRLKSGEGNAGN
jgi:hypothetical protein